MCKVLKELDPARAPVDCRECGVKCGDDPEILEILTLLGRFPGMIERRNGGAYVNHRYAEWVACKTGLLDAVHFVELLEIVCRKQ